jgi:anti-anti-sigma regulatory factor
VEYETEGGRLRIRLRRDFNLVTARQLERLMEQEDPEEVRIDLSRARLVDSEGIIALHRLLESGRKVRLLDPPDIFFEVVRVLGLEEHLDLEALVEERNGRRRR